MDRQFRERLRRYNATVSHDTRTLRLGSIDGSPVVEYRIALDGTLSRRELSPSGQPYLDTGSPWELVTIERATGAMPDGPVGQWLYSGQIRRTTDVPPAR